jgi:DNA ligase-1
MRFLELVELCEKLEATTKRGEMIKIVADFIKRLNQEEIEPALYMLLGRAFPLGQKSLDVSWGTIREAVRKLTRVTDEEFTNVFNRTGDLGSATKEIFEKKGAIRQLAFLEKPLTVKQVTQFFEKMASARGINAREKKERLVETLLSNASSLEIKYLVRIILGEMRTGFNEGLMAIAISRAFDIPLDAVNRARMVAGDAEVARIARERGLEGVNALDIKVFRPVRPMLAENAGSIEEALQTLGGRASFERKLDGARVQIHKLGNEVKIFSRRLTEVTESLSEIVELALRVTAREAIMEGEIVAVDKQGNVLPFQYLMHRFKREKEIGQAADEIPLRLYLFDVLSLNGKNLTGLGYLERRRMLAEVAGELQLVENLISDDVSEIKKFLDETMRQGHEGLMAKRLDGTYQLGARGKLWLKIKPTLEPLDLVIVGAEYGYGRRREWLSDYYLAAIDAGTKKFEILGKTFKGLTDRELREMTAKLKELTIKREGRRVWVQPKIVVEVAYNEIQRSPKYGCGMSLRFARITRIRDDKGPEDADTLQKVRKIYEGQTKGHMQKWDEK